MANMLIRVLRVSVTVLAVGAFMEACERQAWEETKQMHHVYKEHEEKEAKEETEHSDELHGDQGH
ncbi:MAG: hypothetical protein AAF555_11480 [Verrucomicrobiota bacterium]